MIIQVHTRRNISAIKAPCDIGMGQSLRCVLNTPTLWQACGLPIATHFALNNAKKGQWVAIAPLADCYFIKSA
jgi:hypothetical protein